MGVIALNDGSGALEPGDLVAFSRLTAANDSSGPEMAVKKANDANSYAIIGVMQSAYVKEEIPAEAMQLPAPQILEVPEGIEEVAPAAGLIVEGEEPLALPMESQRETITEVAPEAAVEMPSDVYDDAGHFVEGAAQPGQYVAIVIQGIARVKVDASAAPVRAGDMLVASPAGYAIAAPQLYEASQPREDSVKPGEEQGVPAKGLPLSQSPAIGRALESLETGTGAIYVFVSVR
jgi:hypothetical protein